LLDLTRSLTRAHLERWADDHPETPFVNREAVWARVAGSDDHGGLAIARAHTRFSGPATVEALVAAWRTRATIADGDHGGGTTLAHNCYGVLAGYMDARGRTDSLHDTRGGQILKSLVDMRDAASVSVPLVNEDKLRAVAEQALADGWRGALSAAGDALAAGRVGDAADTLGALAKAFALELPYLLAHRFHARDRRSARRFARDLGANGGEIRPLRVAVFTDTIDDVNGVALGLRRLQQAANRLDLDLRIVACGERTTDDGIERIPSVYERELAEYPGLRFSVPHVAPLLRYLVEEEIDLVQCATPAPVGIAALVCARVAGIPVIGQYHTDVPEYALRLTGDPTAAGLVKTLVGWFYASMDRVLVPSAWAGRVATSLGVSTDRIARVPRGVEIARFARTGRGGSAEPIVLYVGRLSREKSIERLFAAFREVVREVPRAQLQIVGGGPQRPELERIAPPNVSFTGVLSGRALVDAYHGAAVFTFPSETETFGNAVAEAQAAGLPAIVAAETATAELIVPGATGFAVDWRDPHSAAAPIIRLLRDPDTRARMAREAAHHASRFEIERAARATFELYDQLVRREAPASSNDLVA
jgi:glycosyltransferase involved in cell wall biosynthesis